MSNIFHFPFQLTASGGSNSVITGFVDNPLSVDLSKPVTFTGWANTSDALAPRTFISIESPDCKTSLINVALPPGSMKVYFAYMVNTQQRYDVYTSALAPGPNADFHLALTLHDGTATVYINGQKQASVAIKPFFNPEKKRVVIGRTKYENRGTAQWNGHIREVKVFDYALSDAEILNDFETTGSG